jgi:hypothetical protein
MARVSKMPQCDTSALKGWFHTPAIQLIMKPP